MHKNGNYWLGVFWSFVSAFLWGTTFVTARFLLAGNRVDPITLATIRFTLGSAVLLGVGLCTCRQQLLAVSKRDLCHLAGLGLCGMCGMSIFLFLGQRTTTAANAALIMQACPLLILFAGVLIGERIRLVQVIGLLISLCGCFLVIEVIGPGGVALSSEHLAGDGMVLLGACCWAVYAVWGKPVATRLGGLVATTWAMFFGALEMLVLRLVLPAECIWPSGLGSWGAIVYLSVLPTAVAFFAWYEAMNHIELSLLNVMQYLTPVVTVALAWVLLGERLQGFQWVGMGLVLAGVAAIGAKRKGSLQNGVDGAEEACNNRRIASTPEKVAR